MIPSSSSSPSSGAQPAFLVSVSSSSSSHTAALSTPLCSYFLTSWEAPFSAQNPTQCNNLGTQKEAKLFLKTTALQSIPTNKNARNAHNTHTHKTTQKKKQNREKHAYRESERETETDTERERKTKKRKKRAKLKKAKRSYKRVREGFESLGSHILQTQVSSASTACSIITSHPQFRPDTTRARKPSKVREEGEGEEDDDVVIVQATGFPGSCPQLLLLLLQPKPCPRKSLRR